MEQMLDLFKRTQNNKEFVALTKRSLLKKNKKNVIAISNKL